MKISYNTHVYLYAKHHYDTDNEGKDIIRDMKIIIAERCGSYVKGKEVNERMLPSVGDVINVLIHMVSNFFEKSPTNIDNQLTTFISNISPETSWKVGYITKECYLLSKEDKEKARNYNFHEALINGLLAFFRYKTVKEIEELEGVKLGEPDYELFPMFKKS